MSLITEIASVYRVRLALQPPVALQKALTAVLTPRRKIDGLHGQIRAVSRGVAYTGKIWEIWNSKLLPVRWETTKVSLRKACQIRRIYRKLARRKGSGSLHRITVFVRYENVVKLQEFLGYCLE